MSKQIVAFCCNYCSYEAADGAGALRKKYPASIKIVRTLCSGRLEPEFILKALEEGADGVLVLGCHPGDCHFQVGNYKTYKRFILLQKCLKSLGLEKKVKLEWISASETDKFVDVVSEFVEEIK